jgi:MFS family permease
MTLDPNVRRLGLVSMLADLSSEIGYVIFPFFVTGVLGAPVALLGLIEGIAEATASITKYPFGQAADRSGRRKPFVLAGYTLGALGKLVIAVAPGWGIALVGRTTDRLGKGMRTAPRDDLIAANTRPGQQGLAFGLHRSMDTLGAVLGPLAAIVMLEAHVPWRWMFAVAVIPGLLSVLVILLLVKDRRETPQQQAFRISLPASPAFRWLLAGSLLFAAGNSSDTFLILKAKDLVGGSLYHAAIGATLLYVLYNIVYAGASLPLGGLSDRVGQYPLVIAGYLVFALVYLGFAAAGSLPVLTGLFAVYGLYIAATEGTSKALIGRAIPTGQRASSLGLYYTTTGLAAFAASAVGGVLWTAVGPWATFVLGAATALVAAVFMLAGHGEVRRTLESAASRTADAAGDAD